MCRHEYCLQSSSHPLSSCLFQVLQRSRPAAILSEPSCLSLPCNPLLFPDSAWNQADSCHPFTSLYLLIMLSVTWVIWIRSQLIFPNNQGLYNLFVNISLVTGQICGSLKKTSYQQQKLKEGKWLYYLKSKHIFILHPLALCIYTE